jgi:aquaporin Z
VKYAVEFIGTFFLMFTVVSAAVFGWAPLGFAPLAIGSVLMVMIFAGGHISGGHYNPAVSIGVSVRGKATYKDMVIYWVAQIIAAAVAVFLAMALVKPPDLAISPLNINMGAAILAEFLFTFALVWVVLNVATSKDTAGNSFYGLAIGFTVLVGAYAVGAISGGAFNPAVTVGLGILGLLSWTNVAIYIVTQLIAGAVAAFVFKATSANDKE